MQKTVILLISIITFISCHATGSDTNYSEQCKSTTATQHSPIVSPEIPQSIEFADTTIEFNRSDLRERIDRELISFSYMHTTSLLIMKRANRWLPEIESILKSEGIPDDFKYLMLIESNCDPLAQSYAGAGGLWQFMPATAKEFSLEVNSSIDERYNVELATHAACKYLRSAYRRFGNWFSVAASYNAGQGRIDSELNKQHADCALDLHLVSETSRYVFRILAAKIILENPEKYGFILCPENLYPPYKYSVETVDYQIDTLATWAKSKGISYAQLKELNPWLRSRSLPNKSRKIYKIRIAEKSSIYYNPKETKNNLP